MLRVNVSNFLQFAATNIAVNESLKTGSNAFAVEFVRWRRKPRWLPVAKSKLFRVPERKEQPIEEKLELQRLYNNYNTQLRSVRQYLREEALRVEATSTKDHIVLTEEQEEQEFQRCLDLNEAWNSERAAERAARLAKEHEQRVAYVKERLALAEERQEEQARRIEAIVRREKELAQNYITRDKLDAAIDYALANPVDYNFSIDLDGNIYRGRSQLPGGESGSGGAGAASDDVDGKQQQLQASN